MRIAAVSVTARYDARPARRRRRCAPRSAKPTPMIDRPELQRMPRQRVRPGRVTSRPFSRCPAAQIRSASPDARRSAAPIASDCARRRASQSADDAERRSRAARASRASAAREISHARIVDARQPPLRSAAHDLGDADVVQAPRRLVAPAIVVAVARVVRATPPTSSGDHGPLRAGSVGPKRPTIGVPTAAAMCIGPVSPDTISARARASATRSAIVGRRRQRRAAPPEAATTASRERLFARPPQHDRRQPARVAQERGERAEALRRPALVRPRRAGLISANGRVRPIGARSASSAGRRARPRAETRSRRRRRRAAQQRAGSCGSTCAAAPASRASGVERPRASSRAGARSKSRRRAPRRTRAPAPPT